MSTALTEISSERGRWPTVIDRDGEDCDFRLPYLFAIVALAPLMGVYLWVLSLEPSETLLRWTNAAGPMYFTVLLGLASFCIIFLNREMIWTPYFWLPAQSAMFFGIGPLVEIYGNDATLLYLSSGVFRITGQELLSANLLSTAGVWFLLLGFLIFLHATRRRWYKNLRLKDNGALPVMSPRLVGLTFVIFGGLLKYLFALPSEWQTLNIVIPGVLGNLVSLLDVGLAILAYLGVKGDKRMLAVFILIWPIHIYLSLLTFAKTHIFIALIFPVFGLFTAKFGIKKLLILILFILLFYPFSQTFIQNGRAIILSESGNIWSAGYARRAEIVYDILFKQSAVKKPTQQVQQWWTRLNYAGPQVAAIKFRSQNVENTSFKNMAYYFIPRVFWPNKPILIPPSLRFYHLVTGNRKPSFLGLSIYGDLYWTAGILGLCIGSCLIGAMFAAFCIRSIRVIASMDYVHFPLVLLPLQASILGPTDFVSNAILSWIPIYIAYAALLKFGVPVWQAIRYPK